MKASEYVLIMTRLVEKYGDLDVETWAQGRRPASNPKLAHRLILKGRESRPEFWAEWQGEERKGDPVFYI